MGRLRNLFYGLNMSANGLTGGIPSEIMKLIQLQSLDISLNNLTGSIGTLEALGSLIEVNISYNFFKGCVPPSLMKLLKSSPSSFMGNSLLSPNSCVDKSHKSTYHKGYHKGISISNVQIVMIAIGSSILISVVLVIIIQRCLLRKESGMEYDLKQHYYIDGGARRIGLGYVQEFNSSGKSFSLKNLVLQATENLSDQYIIGRGAHGIVYKAMIGEQFCAVKKFEFGVNKKKRLNIMRNEIELLEIFRHRNLIKSAGYWIGNDYGLIFYKFIENGSLYDVLHEKKPPPPLSSNVRFNIAVGIAQGLAYLHYDCVPPILHQDIKPKNILVDENTEPIIADFGTALCKKAHEDSYSHSETRKMLSSRVVDTPGYIAPEKAFDILAGTKSDVYSYGVVLLELITRRKLLVPCLYDESMETHIVTWARSIMMETGKIKKIVDPYLVSAFPSSTALVKQVNVVLSLALQCTEKDPRKRPTMKGLIEFYNKSLFKLRCDKVQYSDGSWWFHALQI